MMTRETRKKMKGQNEIHAELPAVSARLFSKKGSWLAIPGIIKINPSSSIKPIFGEEPAYDFVVTTFQGWAPLSGLCFMVVNQHLTLMALFLSVGGG